MATPDEPRITAVAFAKNEGRFLLEWIAYHRLIGVSDFVFFTNDCEDGLPALLERLAEMGIVSRYDNPVAPGGSPQNQALGLHYWQKRNRNDIRDTAIQRHLAGARALMTEWLGDASLAALNRDCFEAYETLLKRAENFVIERETEQVGLSDEA